VAEVESTLRRHWPAVTALAAALVERGELSGEEAMNIVVAAMRAHSRGLKRTQKKGGVTRSRIIGRPRM
jgi:hypothetical protein